METAANAILITDRAGTVLWVNPAFTTLTGYSAEEAIGMTPRILKSGKHDAAFYKDFWKTILSGQTWRGEFTNRRKDGTLYYDEHTVTPVRAAEGKITHFIGIMNDVTERKRAEEELRNTHEQLQQMLAHSPAVLYQLRVEGRNLVPVVVSDNMERLLGFTVAEALSYDWWLGQLHPEDRDRILAVVSQALEGDGYSTEYRLRHKDGTYRWVQDNNRVLQDTSGQPTQMVGVWTDISERKRAEDALAKGALRYKTLMDLSNDSIHFLDEQGDLVEANPAFYRGLGYTAEEMQGMNVADWEAQFNREEIRKRLRGQMDTSSTFETKHRRKDGTIMDVEAGVTGVRLDGKPILFCMTRDITERKRAERALRQSEERFRELAENIQKVFWMTDKDMTQILYVNPAYEKIWGRSCRSLYERPMSFAEAVLPEDRCHLDAMFQHQSLGEPSDEEYRIARPDGSVRWIRDRSFPILDETGQHYRTGGVAEDITERKLAEEERTRLARELELLLSSTDEGIYGLDLNTNCMFINRAGAEMFGFKPEELIGQNMHTLVHHHRQDGSHYPVEDCPVFKSFRKGEGCRVDTEVFFRKDGTFFPVEYSSHPIRENGVVTGAVVAFNDSTARKQLEAQFLRSQRMESIGALAGGIAHDLNNALSPILMATQLLRMKNTNPDIDHKLALIEDSAKRGAGMVRQVLTFARGSENDRGTVQFKHLVKDMAGITRQTFPKTIDIDCHVASDTWTLQANPTQLHQVLLNLCVNARDAMPKGGTLSLTAANTHLDETCAAISPDAKPGPHVFLTVTDNGDGMTPEVCARIFEPFFTTKALEHGTGLGLSTVQGIVKNHGGFITVQSTPGRGTEFKVYLPAQESAAGAAAEAEPVTPPMGNGELILVVDDEAAVRNIATQTLEMFGYQVVAATDGAQAVAVAAQHLGDLQLIVMDIAMPIMDGPTAIRAIRTIVPRMKFIVVSGMDSPAKTITPEELGAEAFLRKPYSADDLLHTVHQVLRGEKPAKE